MYGSSKIKEEIKALSTKLFQVEAKAKAEGRAPTTAEATLLAELDGAIDGLRAALAELPDSAPLSMPGASMGQSQDSAQAAYRLIGPQGKKDYSALFGQSTGPVWTDKTTNFFGAVISGRFHPGLIRASMGETTPSDGGFLVPHEYAQQIHAVSLESELVMPRCFVQPMKSNAVTLPAMSIGDHSSSLFGGFVASYGPEAGTINEANPKARAMELNAKKLTGLVRFSNELAEDVPGGFGQIINICGKGLGWYRDRAFLKGTGAGEPLGILNSPSLIVITPEAGQTADTILFENLCKMMAAMYSGGFANSVWVAHQSTIPQLLQLSMPIGTGGDRIPVMTRADGGFEILTRPVIFTEKTEKLGDQGDIMLADFAAYAVGLRSEMRFDLSIHAHFTTDESLGRLVERHDGQALWDSALTLEDGSTTVSPFVTLAERT